MQHQERFLVDAQRHNLSRQLETEQEHEQCSAFDRNRQMQRRDVHWKDQLNSGFSYNPLIDYKKDLI